MNKKLKKLFISSVIVLASIFILIFLFSLIQTKSKTNSSLQKPEKLILGFSQIGSESAWRTRNTESIFEAAANYDIQLLFDDAQQKQANQLKAIRSFIVYQVDVIAFVPIVEDGWDNVLQEAKDAGIPVIVVDREIKADESLYAGFLGENSYEEGINAARFLVQKCKNQNKTINILEITGTENSSVAIMRAKGFREIIEKENANQKKFEIIHSEDGDFLRSKGKEIINKLVQENKGLKFDNKNIDVLFSHNDSMTLGILDALEENKINTKDIIIISIDAEQKSIDALVEGKLNCVVECNPNLGPTLMQLVQDIAKGNSIPRKTYIAESIFTENDNFLTYTPRGY